jgi:hypothetical protein
MNELQSAIQFLDSKIDRSVEAPMTVSEGVSLLLDMPLDVATGGGLVDGLLAL